MEVGGRVACKGMMFEPKLLHFHAVCMFEKLVDSHLMLEPYRFLHNSDAQYVCDLHHKTKCHGGIISPNGFMTFEAPAVGVCVRYPPVSQRTVISIMGVCCGPEPSL